VNVIGNDRRFWGSVLGQFHFEELFFSFLYENFGFLIRKISQIYTFLKNPNFFVKNGKISSIFLNLETHQGSFLCPFCQLNFS